MTNSSTSRSGLALWLAIGAWLFAFVAGPVISVVVANIGILESNDVRIRSGTAAFLSLMVCALVSSVLSLVATVLARRARKREPADHRSKPAMVLGVLGMLLFGGGLTLVIAFYAWLLHGHWAFG